MFAEARRPAADSATRRPRRGPNVKPYVLHTASDKPSRPGTGPRIGYPSGVYTFGPAQVPTHGGLYAWEFEKGKREFHVRVDGQLVFNTIRQRAEAALAGLGLAYMPEDVAQPHIAQGNLLRVLEDWCALFPGYHLYYPSRRQNSPAFVVLVEALRYQ